MKRKKKYKHKIILNQPIEEQDEDWIGISSYVDRLDEAVQMGAQMVAITSDFGSGKSSMISLLKKRYKRKPRWKIKSINMWSNLEESGGGNTVDKKEANRVELHKSFVYHLISQINTRRGSYLSKRLSKNFGLFQIQGNNAGSTFLVTIAVILFAIGEVLRRFGQDALDLFHITAERGQIIEFIAYLLGFFIIIGVICTSEFLFSSTKSEGNHSFDENVLIDYYTKEIFYRWFRMHYVFVIEDLDRTENNQLVIDFLKEIRKYYLNTDTFRGWLHHNKVTFVVNIKPEALMIGDSNPGLFSKFFDYNIDLKQINIDNYDAVLDGMLQEVAGELVNLGLIEDESEATTDNILGMQWIIRGRHLGMRTIKERLNSVLLLYDALLHKFPDKKSIVSFEKCAVAIYITNEYAQDFYFIDDRKLDELIGKFVAGEDEELQQWITESDEKLCTTFKKEIVEQIEDKRIDTNYRLYFYNYPKGSKLYNVSEMRVYNALLYNEDIYNKEEFQKHLDLLESDRVIDDVFDKIIGLETGLPVTVLLFEKLFQRALHICDQEVFDLITEVSVNVDTDYLVEIVDCFSKFDIGDDLDSHQFHAEIADIWDTLMSEGKILAVRKLLCNKYSTDIVDYKQLYDGLNPFITKEEVQALKDYTLILPLLSDRTLEGNVDVCKQICELVTNTVQKEDIMVNQFFLAMCEEFGIDEVYPYIKAYCGVIKRIPDVINQYMQKQIGEDAFAAQKYVDIISQWDTYENNVVSTINDIHWYGGVGEKLCKQLYAAGHYLSYICNMIAEKREVDFDDDNIRVAIEQDGRRLYENYEQVWLKMREQIPEKYVEIYTDLFAEDYPFITEVELNHILDLDLAISILQSNLLTEENVPYVANYFSKEYRNPKKTFEILNYVCSIGNAALSKTLFYSIDMENVRYRKLATKNMRKILEKMIPIADLEEGNSEERIDYMIHVKMLIPSLEKGLYTDLNAEAELKDKYINFVNGQDAITNETYTNIIKLSFIYVYSDVVLEKLYQRKQYRTYVSSITQSNGRFDVEQDKIDTLWPTYVDMFLSDSYEYTRGKMNENHKFKEMLIEKKAYEGITDKIDRFAFVYQSKDILQYIFGLFDEGEMSFVGIDQYLSSISGFKDRSAAECCVNGIIKRPALLESDSIYYNVHDDGNKLQDGGLKGKYTKARKKMA